MKRFLMMISVSSLLLLLLAYPGYALEGKLIITKDVAFLDKWMKTDKQLLLKQPPANQVFRGQYFSAYFLVSGYQLNPLNQTNIILDVKIEDPDKTLYFEKKNYASIATDIENPKDILLSKSGLRICFKPQDKLGKYTIQLTINDLNAQTTIPIKMVIELVDFKEQKYFSNEASFLEWMNHYYLNPTPEKALDAFLYFSSHKSLQNKMGFYPALAFFLEVFKGNNFLIPYLIQKYENQNPQVKKSILRLLYYLDYDIQSTVPSLTSMDLDFLQQLSDQRLPALFGEMIHPDQLDMLWGVFLATGKYQPVKQIIDALELSQYKGFAENIDESLLTDGERQAAMFDLLYQAVKWTLQNYSSEHQLVLDYCNYRFDHEPLSDSIREELKDILKRQ